MINPARSITIKLYQGSVNRERIVIMISPHIAKNECESDESHLPIGHPLWMAYEGYVSKIQADVAVTVYTMKLIII